MDIQSKKSTRSTSPAEWHSTIVALFKKLHIPYVPAVPGPRGLRLDFCSGLRILVPEEPSDAQYNLELVDLDNGALISKCMIGAGDYFISDKHYFIRWGIQITDHNTGEHVWQYFYNAKGKDVLIKFPVETIGDTLAWFSSAVAFQEKHQCNLYMRIADFMRPLLEPKYPTIHFVSNEQCLDLCPYAAYTVAVFFNDEEHCSSTVDYRTVPLHHYPEYILGVKVGEEPPLIAYQENNPKIEGSCVTIASQASGGCKLWNNPQGWEFVIAFLNKNDYRVLDIDKYRGIGDRINWNKIPYNAEDFTGEKPLTERASVIAQSHFFIGLGSGLSWLAWAVGVPVVMISGFSEPWEEFNTPYRVINQHVCHGCFNDVRCSFNKMDFTFCPRHVGTDRHWECTRSISPQAVINAIQTIPEFLNHTSKNA